MNKIENTASKNNAVGFTLPLYEKPVHFASERNAKTIESGKVIIPKVPTRALPTEKNDDMQEKIKTNEKTIRPIMPNTFFLVKFVFL